MPLLVRLRAMQYNPNIFPHNVHLGFHLPLSSISIYSDCKVGVVYSISMI